MHVTIIERRYGMVRLRIADLWRFSYSRQIQTSLGRPSLGGGCGSEGCPANLGSSSVRRMLSRITCTRCLYTLRTFRPPPAEDAKRHWMECFTAGCRLHRFRARHHDLSLISFPPSSTSPRCLALSFPLYTSVPPRADLFLLRFVFCNPFALVHASPGYTLICNCFFPVQYIPSIVLLRFIYFEFIYFFFFKFTLDGIYVNFFPFFFRFVQTNSDTIYGYHKRSFWIDDNVGWKVYFHESPWIFNGTQLQSVKRRYE